MNQGLHYIHAVKQSLRNLPPIKVDDCLLTMEVDTGASVSESTFFRLWPKRDLVTSHVKLQSYTGDTISVLGCVQTQVSYEGQTAELPLVVVKGKGPTLLGRNWLESIRLNWGTIHYVPSKSLQELLSIYEDVFQEGLGTWEGYEANIEVDTDATPRFCKARSVPYAMWDMVEEELCRLVQEGTLEPVDHAEWAAPIVAVLKADKKSVRVCGDFRLTVNPVSKLVKYPVPKAEDLFATLQGGTIFSKLDLSQAYQQLRLAESSRKYVVVNTQGYSSILGCPMVFHLHLVFF